eukprot:Skav229754  [mRNA]  locus=scaffold1796:81199:84558:- [translate_table: standard]
MRASWRYAGLLVAASSTLPGRSKHTGFHPWVPRAQGHTRDLAQPSDSRGKSNTDMQRLKEMFKRVVDDANPYVALTSLPLRERPSALPSEAIVDYIPAASEVLVCDFDDNWAQIKRGKKLLWTPMVDEQGKDLLAQVLPVEDPTGRQSKRVWQYQRVHDALEVCMKMKQFGPETATLLIPELPLDLLQQLELCGCDTHSDFVRINRGSLRSFPTLDNMQQKMVTASKQVGVEGGPRFPRMIAPGRFLNSKYGITGKHVEQLVWAMGAGPSTAEAAQVVDVISKEVFPSCLCRHCGSANVGTNLLDSDVDLVIHMPTRDPRAVDFVRDRIYNFQQEGKEHLLKRFTVIQKPFCITLERGGQEIDIVPVVQSDNGSLEQFDPFAQKWQLYRGKEHAKQFMVAMERIERLPDLVRLAKTWSRRLEPRREGGRPLLPGLLIQLCLAQLELPQPQSECTLPEQLFFAFQHLRQEWRKAPPEDYDTHARLMAKIEGLEKHVDEALESACKELSHVVKLEKLEWQHLSLAKREAEDNYKHKNSRVHLVFPMQFSEYESAEAKQYADEAISILDQLFGHLNDYLRYQSGPAGYLELAKQMHPDTAGDDVAFQRLQRCYEVLSRHRREEPEWLRKLREDYATSKDPFP